MCYTTDEKARPRTEVRFNSKLMYGTDGYRSNCNNIPVSTSGLFITPCNFLLKVQPTSFRADSGTEKFTKSVDSNFRAF